jgi:hypothetical protein
LIRAQILATVGAIFVVQLSPSQRDAVDEYRMALTAVESRATGATIEDIFGKARVVGDALQEPVGDGRSTLESLTPQAFEELQKTLRGLIVNRDEVILVRPDADFFVALAAKYGTAEDRRFFAAYKTTYPDSVWPVYVQQQTDYSGCTAFGDGKLVAMYRLWSRFHRDVPGNYSDDAHAEWRRVGSELTTSTCACGDRSSVERELQQFLDAFPGAPGTSTIASRLRELKEGRSAIRLNCSSG